MKGILDPKGLQLNPLTNKPYSDKYKDLALKWKTFPVYKSNPQNAIESIQNNQVTLVISSTGSGKTVLFPKFALHATDYKQKVVVTIPKRKIVKSSAEFAALTLDVDLGQEVGYSYRNAPRDSSSDNTKLLFVTDGTLVSKLNRDPLLSEYSVIIVDEVHERNIYIDLLLYYLKTILKQRNDLRVVLMSATVNEQIFINYFSDFRFNVLNYVEPPKFNIQKIFIKEPININKTNNKIMDTIHHIINNNKKAIILAFVPSKADTEEICKFTRNLNSTACLVFTGDSDESMKENFEQRTDVNYKIIAATNVIESSFTFKGLDFVIDSGLAFITDYESKTYSNIIEKKYVAKANIKQRIGRTGRTNDGTAFMLYTKEQYKQFEDYEKPPILRENIENHLLMLLMREESNTVRKLITQINSFITPFSEDSINFALIRFKKLGLITNTELTNLGKIVASLNEQASVGLALTMAHIFGVYTQVNIIMKCLDKIKKIDDLFIDIKKEFRGKEHKMVRATKKLNKIQKYFMIPDSEHITVLNIFTEFYNQYRTNPESIHEWCKENMINERTIMRIKDDVQLPKPEFKETEIEFDKDLYKLVINQSVDNKILFCLYYGFRVNQIEDTDKLDRGSKFNKNADCPKKFYHQRRMDKGKESYQFITCNPNFL